MLQGLLTFDPNARLTVQQALETEYLHGLHDPADEPVAAGLAGRFPADYPVAKVTAIIEDRVRGFVSVRAEPKARLDSSREVLVIKPRDK